MHALQASLTPRFPAGTPERYQQSSRGDGFNFNSYLNNLTSEADKYKNIPLDQIKTKMVKTEVVDQHGNVKEVIKEMAVCPECGETNCPCIARITVQARLDEENAKGVRYAEKPNPQSILPQTFNQLALGLERSNTSRFSTF